ncbi:hypothetical protein [Reyranella sp.]|uniref:hypothetical protein n=1 Tax=Reyranella sp. TaxID=1929291 RepID=UPI003D0FEDC6
MSDDAVVSETVLAAIIDQVTASMARFANLAVDVRGTPPTFAAEGLRTTWPTSRRERPPRLLLPWRVPITEIESVVESGVALDPDADFRLTTGSILLRLVADAPAPWAIGKIVVEYRAGWTLPDEAPADLAAAAAEQARYVALAAGRDPGVRSYTTPDLEQVSFNVPGGNSIGSSGLLIQVETALAPYRHFSV